MRDHLAPEEPRTITARYGCNGLQLRTVATFQWGPDKVVP